MVRVIADKVDREFSAHDQFLKKRRPVLKRSIGFFHGHGDGVGRNVSEVEIRRKLTRAVEVGLISSRGIARKSKLKKLFESSTCLHCPAYESGDGLDGTIDGQLLQ